MGNFEVTANGMTFRGIEEGPRNGPLALLLHGFPDSHHTWRHLIGPLADAGFHAVAPALRGYAPSDLAPDGNYQMAALALDATSLHNVFGGDENAVLIGHDWGAIVAYCASASSPSAWRTMVTLAVPPTNAIAEAFMTFDQLQRSWYMFLFQSALAEFVVPMNDLDFLARLWNDWSPDYDATEDMAFVREALSEPERTIAALTYYRAMLQPELHDPALQEVQDALNLPTPIPTLYLHGANDGCFGVDSIGDPLASFPTGSKVEIIANAGHFLHLEQPGVVGEKILSFVS